LKRMAEGVISEARYKSYLRILGSLS